MGQFDRFIEPAGTSPRAVRAVQLLLPAVWIARAVHTPTPGHIALATGFAVLFLDPLPSLGVAAAAMSVYFVVLLVLGRRRNRRTVVAG